MQHYDIVIIGGGLVGAGLALALQDTNLRIALVDARLPSNDDPRLFALNIKSCQFLQDLNLWPELALHAAEIKQVHVSNQGRFGVVRLNAQDANLNQLGFVIPAYLIETAMNTAIEKIPNVTLYRPAKLMSLVQADNLVTLHLESEASISITANAVIGADGTESTIRKLLNIDAEVFEYQQSALVTRTQLQRPHKNIAYERFTADGAIAMLPLIGDECATIWSGEKNKIAALQSLSDQEFIDKLQKEFGYRLGRLQAIKKRFTFPLRMLKVEKPIHEKVFLLGNAAHTLHPIAAQGFNLAIYEVKKLVSVIKAKVAQNQPIDQTDFQQVLDQSKKKQALSMNLSHALPQLFNHKSWFNKSVPWGMVGLDILTPLKKQFINKIIS